MKHIDYEVLRNLNLRQREALISCISSKVFTNFKFRRLRYKGGVISWTVDVRYSGELKTIKGTSTISQVNSRAISRFGEWR